MLMNNADEEQTEWWLQKALNREFVGTYAQTGSNLLIYLINYSWRNRTRHESEEVGDDRNLRLNNTRIRFALADNY